MIAAGHYAAVTEALLNTERVADQEYSKLKSEAEEARRVCERAEKALRVHQEGHKGLCRYQARMVSGLAMLAISSSASAFLR